GMLNGLGSSYRLSGLVIYADSALLIQVSFKMRRNKIKMVICGWFTITREKEHERLIHARPYRSIREVGPIEYPCNFHSLQYCIKCFDAGVSLLEKDPPGQRHGDNPPRFSPLDRSPQKRKVRVIVRVSIILRNPFQSAIYQNLTRQLGENDIVFFDFFPAVFSFPTQTGPRWITDNHIKTAIEFFGKVRT